MIQPSPGVMLEYEWPNWLPREVLFPVMRVPMREASAAGYAEIVEQAPAAAKELASASCNAIAFACALASVFAGREAEQNMLDDLQNACELPVVGLGAASVAALRKLNVRNPAVLTPYGEEANAWLASYLCECGITVSGIISTPVDIRTVGSLSPAEVTAVALAGLAENHAADGLWIPCTAIQTMAAIAPIEAVSGRPVVSGSQALLKEALAAVGQVAPIARAGALFS